MIENLFNFNYPYIPMIRDGWFPTTDIEDVLINIEGSGMADIGFNHVDLLEIINQITRAETYAKTGMILAAVAVLALIIVLINQIRTRKMLKKLLDKETQEEE